MSRWVVIVLRNPNSECFSCSSAHVTCGRGRNKCCLCPFCCFPEKKKTGHLSSLTSLRLFSEPTALRCWPELLRSDHCRQTCCPAENRGGHKDWKLVQSIVTSGVKQPDVMCSRVLHSERFVFPGALGDVATETRSSFLQLLHLFGALFKTVPCHRKANSVFANVIDSQRQRSLY